MWIRVRWYYCSPHQSFSFDIRWLMWLYRHVEAHHSSDLCFFTRCGVPTPYDPTVSQWECAEGCDRAGGWQWPPLAASSPQELSRAVLWGTAPTPLFWFRLFYISSAIKKKKKKFVVLFLTQTKENISVSSHTK